METTPVTRLLIYGMMLAFLVSMSAAFFYLTGKGGIRAPKSTGAVGLGEVLYEPTAPEEGRRAEAPPAEIPPHADPEISPNREPAVPETAAEEQYFAAVQKLSETETAHQAHLQRRDKILEFLATPAGKDLTAIAELAKRGRTAEARTYLPRVLANLADTDLAIQEYALQLAILIYKQEKDDAALKDAMQKYLQMGADRLTNARDLTDPEKKSMPQVLETIEKFQKQLSGEAKR